MSSAHACDFFEALSNFAGIQRAVRRRLRPALIPPARPALQIVHGIRGHQLALVDDDDPSHVLLDFRQDVRAQDNRVIAGEAFDQIAGFVDLFGIEACSRSSKMSTSGL